MHRVKRIDFLMGYAVASSFSHALVQEFLSGKFHVCKVLGGGSSIFHVVHLLISMETYITFALESPYHLAAVSGAHFTQGTILIVILVSSGSAKSRTHQSAVGGFLVTRRGWP